MPVQTDVVAITTVIVIDHVLPSGTKAEIVEVTVPATLVTGQRRKAVAAKMAAKVPASPTIRSRSGSSFFLKVLNDICSIIAF